MSSAAPPISDIKRRLLKRLAAGGHQAAPPLAPVAAAFAESPLLPGQQQIWTAEQFADGIPLNNLAVAYCIDGPLAIEALESALGDLVGRHEALTLSFGLSGETPIQRPLPITHLPLSFEDLSAQGAGADAGSMAILQSAADAPFNLEAPPLCRAVLVRAAEERHWLGLTAHHLVADAWSLGVIVSDLSELYASRCETREPAAAPRASFRAYAEEVARRPQELREAAVAHFAKLLSDAPVLQLPGDGDGGGVAPSEAGALEKMAIPAQLWASVTSLASRLKLTPFIVSLAAYQLTLVRLAGQEEVCVGVAVNGRGRQALEDVVGCFINTIPVRAAVGDESFADFAGALAEQVSAGSAHQLAPLAEVAKAFGRDRRAAKPTLFQAMFVFQNSPLPPLRLEPCRVQPVSLDGGTSKFDVTLFVSAHGETPEITFEYRTDRFRREDMQALGRAFLALLESACRDPSCPGCQLPMLSEREMTRSRLIRGDDGLAIAPALVALDGALSPPRAGPVIRCAARTLDRSAALERIGSIQATLQAAVPPGSRIGLFMERSELLPAAMLGILRSGCAYVPLDPLQPDSRLAAMIEAARPDALLVSEGLQDRAVSLADAGKIILAENAATAALTGAAKVGPDDLAYVIFTSGSTGVPKGVQVTRGGLSNLLGAFQHELGLGPTDRFLATTTIGFDISGLEILLPLLCGAELVLADDDEARDPWAVAERLTRGDANYFQATPTFFRALLGAGWTGAKDLTAICGGEPMTTDLAEMLRPKVGRLLNAYGPTETTIWSTTEWIERPDGISAGRPILNTGVWIRGTDGRPAPIGAIGEVVISGRGVARGYLGPEGRFGGFMQDDAAFGPSPAYATGDRGLIRRDGRLHILGRADHDQLKIRGNRISPREVEQALRRLPGISDAAVGKALPGADDVLVAYVSPLSAPDLPAVRLALRRELPDYMIPTALVRLESLPRSAAGKLDRGALLALAPTADHREVADPGRAPIDDLERDLRDAIREALGWSDLSVTSDLFERGADSLDLIRIASRLRDRFQVQLTVRELLTPLTSVEAIAAAIRGQPRDNGRIRALLDEIETGIETEGA